MKLEDEVRESSQAVLIFPKLKRRANKFKEWNLTKIGKNWPNHLIERRCEERNRRYNINIQEQIQRIRIDIYWSKAIRKIVFLYY